MQIDPYELPWASEMLESAGHICRALAREIGSSPPSGENAASWLPERSGKKRFGFNLSVQGPRIVPLALGRKSGAVSESVSLEFGEEFSRKAASFMRALGKDIDESSMSSDPGWSFERICVRMKLLCGDDMRLRHAMENGLCDIRASDCVMRLALLGSFDEDGTFSLAMTARFDRGGKKGDPMIIGYAAGPVPKDIESFNAMLDACISESIPSWTRKFAGLGDQDYMVQKDAEAAAREEILNLERDKFKDREEPSYEPVSQDDPLDSPWGASVRSMLKSSSAEFASACSSRYGFEDSGASGAVISLKLDKENMATVDREAARIGGSGDICRIGAIAKKMVEDAWIASASEHVARKYGIPNDRALMREIPLFMSGIKKKASGQPEIAASNVAEMVSKLDRPVLSFTPVIEYADPRHEKVRIWFRTGISGSYIPDSVRKAVEEMPSGIHEGPAPGSAPEFMELWGKALKGLARKVDAEAIASKHSSAARLACGPD